MARKSASTEAASSDERERPVRTMVALVVGFLVIVAVAVATVLVPELRDDTGAEEEGDAPAAAAPPSSAASPPAASP